MNITHLDIHPPCVEGDRVVHAATVRDGNAAEPDERFWFAVSAEHAAAVTDAADPFVRALIHSLMRRAKPVRVHGRVSPGLLRNLEEYRYVWHAWYPNRYAPVDIVADEERPDTSPADPMSAISSFSGGVDSLYTLRRHVDGLVNRRRVDVRAVMFASGLDQDRRHAEAYRAACDRFRGPLADLGVELIPVEINSRDMRVVHGQSFAAVAIGAMSLFAPRFGMALFPAGSAYVDLAIPCPSSPMTDPLLSGDGLAVFRDGSEVIRPKKIDAIADWPVARRLLRVCNDEARPYENCGCCEKCVRTILGFRLGGAGLPECFDTDVTDAMIRSVRLRSPSDLIGFRNLLRRAAEVGAEREPWVDAVRAALRRGAWHSRATSFRNWLRRQRARVGLYRDPFVMSDTRRPDAS